MPRIPGLLERIQQPLYDNGTVATSATTNINFFQVARGSSSKTYLETNMDQGGSLAYPKNFEIHALRMIHEYGSTVADVSEILDAGWFKLFIGTKDYLVVNSFMLTAGVGLAGVATGDTALASVQNGRADQRGIYVLAEPIDLIPQQNFHCELNFPTAPTPASATDVWVYLDGFFKREVH